jgi:hypothetical protein
LAGGPGHVSAHTVERLVLKTHVLVVRFSPDYQEFSNSNKNADFLKPAFLFMHFQIIDIVPIVLPLPASIGL